jgi:hypothetical protein
MYVCMYMVFIEIIARNYVCRYIEAMEKIQGP